MSEQDELVTPTLQENDEVESQTTDESVDTDLDELKARLEKAEELANNYKIRAEKAEKATKVAPKQEVAPQAFSIKDQLALIEAKVSSEDVDIVVEYAKFKGISIADAAKSSVVKAELADRAEQRNSALAANVGTSKRGIGKVSDDMILAKAEKGELPDSEEEMKRLWRIRKGLK